MVLDIHKGARACSTNAAAHLAWQFLCVSGVRQHIHSFQLFYFHQKYLAGIFLIQVFSVGVCYIEFGVCGNVEIRKNIL